MAARFNPPPNWPPPLGWAPPPGWRPDPAGGGRGAAGVANDPLNLLAVDGNLNAAKGDGDAATWLPPRKSYRCAFVARQAAVKAKYGLWLAAAEREVIARLLSTCPAEKAPRSAAPTLAPLSSRSRAGLAGSSGATAAPRSSGGGSTDVRFDTCAAAKAAGYGPYTAGVDPEYDWYRDADSDGVVCE